MPQYHRSPTPTTLPVTVQDALVVDADEGIRLALRAILEDAGYRVSEAKTGRETLRYLLTNPHTSVILLDVSQPLSEDLLLLTWICSGEPPTARHAFVLLSTNPGGALGPALGQALACGVPVVPKPFDIDDLLDAVTSARGHLPGTVIVDMPVLTSASRVCEVPKR